MPAQDFQTLVIELEQRGWLRRVRVEVNPILEISEIADRTVKAGGPALLFERVRGSNIPVLINTFGTKQRMCHALGVDDFQQLADRVKALIKPEMPTTLLEKIKKLPQLIALGSLPPKIVRRGICQEVIHREDADLTVLPTIKCWPGDGDLTRNVYAHVMETLRAVGAGQEAAGVAMPSSNSNSRSNISVTEGSELAREYFGERGFLNHNPGDAGSTGCNSDSKIQNPQSRGLAALLPPQNDGRYLTLTNVFTKNPHTGERNIGMYRVQVLGPKLAAMHWHMHHDGARHFRMHREMGKRMPIAVSFGGPAVMPYAATCPLPPGIDECLFAGFLNGGSIELVACVSQPEIEVPASAEIVIEGYIDPADMPVIEGPFGDHTGFYSLADLYPRMHITAITHRRNPIYPTTIVGKPPQEDFWLGKATERIFLPLLQTIIPDIIDYNLPLFGCFHNCAFVKIKKEYPYQARRVMSAIWGAGQMCFTKMIVVVDAHVNVHDENEVLFHMLANCDPRRDCVIAEGPLDILDHASPGCGVGSKIGWDATRKWPAEGAVRTWPDELAMSAEIRELVSRRWKEYGL